MIVTFAGCYLRRIGGWIAVADLICCLGAAGVTEPAVRQALVRLKNRGFLDAERRHGAAGYVLTSAGHADLEPGDRRIFRFGQADPEAGWVLAVFSVPEERRHHRHQLRTQLGWLGFGTVGPGVWVAPAALERPARDLLSAGRLGQYVTWFRASSPDVPDVARWWDLEGLRVHYDTFLAGWRGQADATDATLAIDGATTGARRWVEGVRELPPAGRRLAVAATNRPWPAGGAASSRLAGAAGVGRVLHPAQALGTRWARLSGGARPALIPATDLRLSDGRGTLDSVGG